MKTIFINYSILLILIQIFSFKCSAQLDYSDLNNWVFHPEKSGTLIDGYNLDIAVVNHKLEVTKTLPIPNNAMKNTGIDVFFVHPTILTDMTGYTERKNISLSEQPKQLIAASILGQVGLMGKYGRFYAPHYSQGTPPTYIGSALDTTQARVIMEAYKDVKYAFLHYLENHNNGNKIIVASHSQGAYLASMLLREFFDNDETLQEKLLVAVIAGVIAVYAEANQLNGGWWQNLPICTKIDQCNCIMTWRSFKEGQNFPIPSFSLPSLNSFLKDSGLVYRTFSLTNDWTLQDSLYYNQNQVPLRNYLFPKTNQSYGGNVGFIAFDSLYRIRYHRQAPRRIGYLIEHTPIQDDQRPNDLQAEESNPLFDFLGLHNKDYAIIGWALLEQIDTKIKQCASNVGKTVLDNTTDIIKIYPNPSNKYIYINTNTVMSSLILFDIYGKKAIDININSNEHIINVTHLKNGMYIIKITLMDKTEYIQKIFIDS